MLMCQSVPACIYYANTNTNHIPLAVPRTYANMIAITGHEQHVESQSEPHNGNWLSSQATIECRYTQQSLDNRLPKRKGSKDSDLSHTSFISVISQIAKFITYAK